MPEYRILYKVLDPAEVSDLVAVGNPNHGRRQIKAGSYTYGSRSLKAVRDPKVCKPHTGNFFDYLEESILKDGFRNPLFCIKTHEGMFVVYGMSRLWLAKHHKMPIPSIIADYTGKYEGEVLNTKQKILDKFIDPPGQMMITTNHMEIWGCDHTHMPEGQQVNQHGLNGNLARQRRAK